MSKRRKVGDTVWKKEGAGFVGQSGFVQIMPEESPDSCFGRESCSDPDCREWATCIAVNSDGTPSGGMACHVSECEMLDGPPGSADQGARLPLAHADRPLRLWLAVAEVQVVIAAPEIPTAMEVSKAAKEEVDDTGSSVIEAFAKPVEIEDPSDIPMFWHASRPRSSKEVNCRMTCEEVLDRLAAWEAEKRARQPMPNQKELPL